MEGNEEFKAIFNWFIRVQQSWMGGGWSFCKNDWIIWKFRAVRYQVRVRGAVLEYTGIFMSV